MFRHQDTTLSVPQAIRTIYEQEYGHIPPEALGELVDNEKPLAGADIGQDPASSPDEDVGRHTNEPQGEVGLPLDGPHLSTSHNNVTDGMGEDSEPRLASGSHEV